MLDMNGQTNQKMFRAGKFAEKNFDNWQRVKIKWGGAIWKMAEASVGDQSLILIQSGEDGIMAELLFSDTKNVYYQVEKFADNEEGMNYINLYLSYMAGLMSELEKMY